LHAAPAVFSQKLSLIPSFARPGAGFAVLSISVRKNS
jgi:hypothetical protein